MLYILLCGVPPFWGEQEKEVFKSILDVSTRARASGEPHRLETACPILTNAGPRSVSRWRSLSARLQLNKYDSMSIEYDI